MRGAVVLVFPLALLAAACGEVRKVHQVSLEGQSPPAPPPPAAGPGVPMAPPPKGSALADSPSWLRQNSPIQWTCPPGWEEILSTKPMRLVEFNLDKGGDGKPPTQFLILNGADESPGAKSASFTRWQTYYREDQAPQTSMIDQNGVKGTRYRVHGEYDGPSPTMTGEMLKEPNWTMIYGYVEGPAGSIMFRVQGPDAVIESNMSKIDALLASMRPAEKKAQ